MNPVHFNCKSDLRQRRERYSPQLISPFLFTIIFSIFQSIPEEFISSLISARIVAHVMFSCESVYELFIWVFLHIYAPSISMLYLLLIVSLACLLTVCLSHPISLSGSL